ncbi:MAG: cytochrome c1 [Gallionellaceae bacterium]|nr:cytochrome c1 [Gallionellaceae bacterium]
MRTAMLKKFVFALLFAPVVAFSADTSIKLDRAPDRVTDKAALQNGAKLFVNYCLNCHGASFVRYNRLTEIGLTEQQIKDNLMFTADKIGEPMGISMPRKDAKEYFGAWPPDLSLIARARASGDGTGADWLYTYLRGFYRDEKRPTGWNNVVFESVGMPHVLWELQGEQVMGADHKLTLAKPGKLTPKEYDDAVGDLVAFMGWMAEPQAEFRKHLGLAVMLFLGVFFVVAYAMKRVFWKDIH